LFFRAKKRIIGTQLQNSKSVEDQCLMKTKKLAEHNARQKQQNPEAYAAKRKASYLRSKIKRREAVFAKLGLQCECCGESDIRFLTVEHKLNDGAEDRKIRSHEKLYRDILKMNEIEMHEQFETLCMLCNFAKGLYKICPHREAENGEENQ